MSKPSNPPEKKENEPPEGERRGPDRASDDADWESKVMARVGSRLRKLPAGELDQSNGWESSVVDTLRRKIERGPT